MANSKFELLQATVPNNEGIVGTPTIFTFEFNKDIGLASSAIRVTFYIWEHKVIKTPRIITKPLKPFPNNPKKATAELTFPESLAGAKLSMFYVFSSPITDGGIRKLNIEIIQPGKQRKIEKIYWGEQEHALWGTKLTERKEICKNEVGFLHIYTKGMFGHEVWVELKEEDLLIDDSLEERRVIIQDNVVSVPYSMESVLSTYKSKRWTLAFEGKTLELYGRAHTERSKLKNGLKSALLLLDHEKTASNPSQTTKARDVKVKITTDEEDLGEPTKAQCIVQFRPDNTYIGDYGFDWIRMGDANDAPGYHNDYSFEDHMGKHYYTTTRKVENDGNKHGNDFKKDKDPNTIVRNYDTGVVDTTFGDGKMYTRLKLRYRKLIFNWSPKNAAESSYETYAPIMTILNGKIANLALHLDIKQEPKEIVFEFDHSSANLFFDLEEDKLTEKLSKTNNTDKTNHTLKIKCKGEFDREYTLFARAFKKDNSVTGVDRKGEICGMIRILPNAPQFQHRVKIAFIGVTTNLVSSVGLVTGSAMPDAIAKLKDLFGQALLMPEIDSSVVIDATEDSFKQKYCILKSGSTTDYVIDYNKYDSMKVFLMNKLKNTPNGKKYEHYYKVFFIGEDVNTTTIGYSYGEKYVVCFNRTKSYNSVITHEILHALELAHPFDAYSRNTLFSHNFCTTDNVMDYSQTFNVSDVRSIFHWQWQIINTKIR